MEKSIRGLVIDFFQQHPKQDVTLDLVAHWVTEHSISIDNTGHLLGDIWRAIRQLHQEGILIKVNKGVYQYNPERARDIELYNFPPHIKEAIFKRDNYKCVFCGLGRNDGVKIFADSISLKAKGRNSSISNSMTLCDKHYSIKKNRSHLEAGKVFFQEMYEKAVTINDLKMINFCKCILDSYDQYKIDGHIKPSSS
jgi:predicted restriction endonuclease